MYVRSFVRLSVHPSIRSFVRSFFRSFVRSFVYTFVRSLIRPCVRLLLNTSFVRSSVRSSVCSSVRYFIISVHHNGAPWRNGIWLKCRCALVLASLTGCFARHNRQVALNSTLLKTFARLPAVTIVGIIDALS